MENNKTQNLLKISAIIGILAVSASLSYYFVVRPINKDAKLKNCLKEAEQVQGWDRDGGSQVRKSEKAKDYCFKLY